MNVYDMAHNLARAIKDSQEYKDYEAQKIEIEKNEDLSKMIKDFQAKQLELQLKQMSGESIQGDIMTSAQELYKIVMANPKASEYMQTEMRFSIMMNDVNKIIGEAIGVNADMIPEQE